MEIACDADGVEQSMAVSAKLGLEIRKHIGDHSARRRLTNEASCQPSLSQNEFIALVSHAGLSLVMLWGEVPAEHLWLS